MEDIKNEMVTGAELARRLKVTKGYITNRKKDLITAKCMRGKKYKYEESAKFLGKDPSNPHATIHSLNQKKKPVLSETEIFMRDFAAGNTNTYHSVDEAIQDIESRTDRIINALPQRRRPPSDDYEPGEEKSLLDQIKTAMKDPKTTSNPALLNGLKVKASIMVEYHKAQNEELKHRKQVENLYDREEVLKILGFLANALRSTLLNMPNNYAVNLEGMSQKQINDFVTDDVNSILDQIQKTAGQFKNE